jgi:hypothetical protein
MVLALLHAVALGVGLRVGSASQGRSAPTPLAELGFALTEADWGTNPEAHQRLSQVAETARRSFPEADRGILDLVLTVRGVGAAGQVDWERAMAQCNELGWPRCDRPAMEELARRARP